ncbi:MAG: protein kinase [Proteobacteria bacterium]|nr:protein kinase [Pseudomonadota bacterium]
MSAKPELDDTATAPGLPPVASGGGLATGQQLGHFRVERKLGAGGMGEVYLATDLALDRPVALKVLPDELARDPVRRDRLIREARAQARINHPNVGHIYFVGEDTGRLFFAMEYVAGVTLGDKVAGGPLAADEALALIRAAALGLREAQRSGFTHRDVKPSNLMLDGHGVVKVLDFGLVAGALDPHPVDGTATVSAHASPQTSLAGTPLYMAPEQARGEPVDLRADIYALGATLYHLVSGQPPFVADTVQELRSMHASARRPALPRGKHARTSRTAIDALCARMMAPEPAARFASYDELIRAVELASVEQTRPAGFWVRLIATTIDVMLMLVIVGIGSFLVDWLTGYGSTSQNLLLFTFVGVLQVIETTRRGRTPGKTLFELEVVSLATGEPPPLRAAILRSLVMLGVPVLGGAVALSFDLAGYDSDPIEVVTMLSFPLIVLVLLVASLASANKRAPWDRAANTVVRYRHRRSR